MDRRGFLGTAATIVAASKVGRAGAAEAPPPVASGSGGAAADVSEATIGELQRAMAEGQLSAEQLVEHCISRINRLDRQGPGIHAVLESNPEARVVARALDQERRAKGPRGPLHGIPILLKDNIDTGDRMTTTAGSRLLEGSIARQDATVAARLRAAGAVLLGKANMSEWANFRSTHSSSGWSGRGGQGHNPYALDRTTCGSSSGSAGAVAAGYCPVAVGTETDGSIICPAAAHSLVGIKPTVGLVSRAGIIPISATQDTAGPIARTVEDAAILLAALAGPDPRDPATGRRRTAVDYTAALRRSDLSGLRIGVARKTYFGYHPATDALAEEAVRQLSTLGATVVDHADVATAGDWNDAEYQVLLYEFKAGVEAYLATLGSGRPRRLAELIEGNRKDAARGMPYFGQEIFEEAVEKGPLSTPAYRRALATCRQLARTRGLDATLARHRLDALVAPSGGPPWLIDLINGDHETGSSYGAAAVAGYPGITVPAGYVRGLPVGVSFFGGPWSEPTLIRIAHAYEQATKHRRAPTFAAGAMLG